MVLKVAFLELRECRFYTCFNISKKKNNKLNDTRH